MITRCSDWRAVCCLKFYQLFTVLSADIHLVDCYRYLANKKTFADGSDRCLSAVTSVLHRQIHELLTSPPSCTSAEQFSANISKKIFFKESFSCDRRFYLRLFHEFVWSKSFEDFFVGQNRGINNNKSKNKHQQQKNISISIIWSIVSVSAQNGTIVASLKNINTKMIFWNK